MSMVNDKAYVRVPASTANLGPGFDNLGLALNIWNEVRFQVTGEHLVVENHGLLSDYIPKPEKNMLVIGAKKVFEACDEPFPEGLRLESQIQIPVRSGMGSSAATILAGVMGADMLLGNPLERGEILKIVGEMEGHYDNASASLFGGLTLALDRPAGTLVRRYDVPPYQLVICTPKRGSSTEEMRALLPQTVSLQDAIFNIGNTVAVVDMLRSGSITMLDVVMQDKLHQPHRLKLIPGSEQAIEAARDAGAKAVALSGAGPSLIAFCQPDQAAQVVGQAMIQAYRQAGESATFLITTPADTGAQAFA
ncbi:MAG: homoserine kinase [Anaerolineaceae bacterium]|nr:homoserine kinase [Anaerolineaceae bacterium]